MDYAAILIAVLIILVIAWELKPRRRENKSNVDGPRSDEEFFTNDRNAKLDPKHHKSLHAELPNYKPSTAPDLSDGRWVGWNFCARVDVAGVHHHRDAAFNALKAAKFEEIVELRYNPENPHDRNAIEVWFGPFWVGHIDKDMAKAAAEYLPLNMPICARYVDAWLGDGGFLRLTIQPLMPDAKTRQQNGWIVKRRK